MSDSYCGAIEDCILAGKSWPVREVAQLALAGNAKELSKGCYATKLYPALSVLEDCSREGCSLHRETEEARLLLAKLDAEYEARLDDVDARAW